MPPALGQFARSVTLSPHRIDNAVHQMYRVPAVYFGAQAALDSFAWALSIVLAVALRLEFELAGVAWVSVLSLALVAALLHIPIGWLFALYRGRYTYGSFEEVLALGLAVMLETAILGLAIVLFGAEWGIPRSAVFIAFPFVLVLTFGARYLRRLFVEKRQKPRLEFTPALVVGAGHLGESLIRSMLSDPVSALHPVGIIDDDRQKRNRSIRGIPVKGTIQDIPAIAAATGSETLVVAIARADAALMRRINDVSRAAGMQVLVLPLLDDILAGSSRLSDLRNISIEDLIGRQPVDTQIESIADYVTGRRVLVTGAGGSIGAELCRQLSKFGPGELIMLDRDESGLQHAQIVTVGHGLLHTSDVVLADIRDREAIDEIFETRRPEVVFHAAALKHLPMLEQYPDEAWKTNVIGTLNIIEAARAVGVDTFVNISTDKAANPTSVLGHSKRVAEKLTAWAAETTGKNYLSVRFGNVIGSRGSMLPTFRSLIESGGPVTVTHPDATRYFMTIPEACQLVVQAGAIGQPGEVLILDMGEPVRILDVARRMIALSNQHVEIVFTGLRDGEKLHEDLVGAREVVHRPIHPKISHARVDSISPEMLNKKGWEERMTASPRLNDTQVIPQKTRGS